MDTVREVARVLDDVLSLNGRSASYMRSTHLIGAIPELDSMAVVGVISAIEERFGILVDDDDIDGETFASVGSLADFVDGKLASARASAPAAPAASA
jgi:acyl carrier protein